MISKTLSRVVYNEIQSKTPSFALHPHPLLRERKSAQELLDHPFVSSVRSKQVMVELINESNKIQSQISTLESMSESDSDIETTDSDNPLSEILSELAGSNPGLKRSLSSEILDALGDSSLIQTRPPGLFNSPPGESEEYIPSGNLSSQLEDACEELLTARKRRLVVLFFPDFFFLVDPNAGKVKSTSSNQITSAKSSQTQQISGSERPTRRSFSSLCFFIHFIFLATKGRPSLSSTATRRQIQMNENEAKINKIINMHMKALRQHKKKDARELEKLHFQQEKEQSSLDSTYHAEKSHLQRNWSSKLSKHQIPLNILFPFTQVVDKLFKNHAIEIGDITKNFKASERQIEKKFRDDLRHLEKSQVDKSKTALVEHKSQEKTKWKEMKNQLKKQKCFPLLSPFF